nr:hypothetical protein [Lactiplantibacillus fabifermentans]
MAMAVALSKLAGLGTSPISSIPNVVSLMTPLTIGQVTMVFMVILILQKNSSVEHTAIDRVKLFNRYQTPAKIVTKMYDRLLHRTIDDFGVKSDEVLNMFDFFQGTATVPTKVMHTEDLHLPTEYAIQVGANFSVISNGDDIIENVGFIPGTIGRVFYQEYVDNQGNLLSTDLWDWRGFKSSTQYFGQNGKW